MENEVVVVAAHTSGALLLDDDLLVVIGGDLCDNATAISSSWYFDGFGSVKYLSSPIPLTVAPMNAPAGELSGL